MTNKTNRLPRYQISNDDIFQNAFCGMIIVDNHLNILDANDTILTQLGLSLDKVLGTNIKDICSKENDLDSINKAIATNRNDGDSFFDMNLTSAGNNTVYFRAQIKTLKHTPQKLYLITTIETGHIEEKKQSTLQEQSLNFRQLQALFTLSQLDTSYSEEHVINYALEEAVRFTNSFGGYLHFMHSDQVNLELFTWSSEVKKICTATKVSHYPISQAGIWVDCVKKSAPVIHNDYQSIIEKKGYPHGHFPLIRHMSVPIFDNDKIVAVAGVGNKTDPYNETDVVRLELFVDSMWKILQKRRMTSLLIRYKSILHNAPMLLSFIDSNYTYQFVNRYYCTALELEEEFIIGKTISDVFGKDIFESTIKQHIDAALAGKIATYEWCFSFKHFGNRFLSSVYFPHYENNKLAGIFAMSTDITKLKKTEEKLTILSNTDPLTNLYNRRHFLKHLDIEIARAKRSRNNLALFMIDLDDFKKINDNYGHNIGDKVLTYCANILIEGTRPIDIIGRLGGEEIGIILPATSRNNAAEFAKRIINLFNSNTFISKDVNIKVTASIGVAIYPEQAETGKQILIAADNAMYKAKRNGKNQFALFE